MIWRYLISKVGLFITLVWIADRFSIPVPTDVYTLFVLEILVLVVAIPVTWVWKSFL